MISKINQIKNVGQYEDFNSELNFNKNTIIFGFNGAGKSTFSDIFYSLAEKNKESILLRRRTLNRENEDEIKDMHIEIACDDQHKLIFEDEKWNESPKNIFVFNEQYIKEHVFVSQTITDKDRLLSMGKDGVWWTIEKENKLQKNKQCLNKINEDIRILMESGEKIKPISRLVRKQAIEICSKIDANIKDGQKITVYNDRILMYVALLMYNVKHISWSYENEFRCSLSSKDSYFTVKPSEIYIGMNCDEKNIKLLEEIADYLEIPIYRMKFKECDDSYQLCADIHKY